MRTIYYNSDITLKSAAEIKLLTLYYDKIIIVNDAVYSPKFSNENGKFEFAGVEDLQFIPRGFRQEYKSLIDEGIIEITKRDEKADDPYEKRFSKEISEVVNANHDFIFPVHPDRPDDRIVTEEVYDIMKSMLDFKWGKPVEADYIWWYYSFKLKWFLKLLLEGNTCITSSGNLQHLFASCIEKLGGEITRNIEGQSKSLAFDALKFALPNPDIMTIDDVLELKIKLKDELALFSASINEIEVRNKAALGSEINNADYQSVLFTEIQKPLRELEIKMQNLKSKTFRLFVEKLKDYKTYVPIVGSVVASLPMQYAVLISLGLTAGQTYLEYKEEHRQVSNNGLYYLLKLK